MIHWIKSFGNPGKTAYNDPITKPIIKAKVIVGCWCRQYWINRLEIINPVTIPKPTINMIGNAFKLKWSSSEMAYISVPYTPKTSNINDPEMPGNNIALEAKTPAIKYLMIRLKDKVSVSPVCLSPWLSNAKTTIIAIPNNRIE